VNFKLYSYFNRKYLLNFVVISHQWGSQKEVIDFSTINPKDQSQKKLIVHKQIITFEGNLYYSYIMKNYFIDALKLKIVPMNPLKMVL
jgi:hypothetical protein